MGYVVVHFEVASSSSFQDIPRKSFGDGGGGGTAAVDIDDSIKRKRIRVSLKKCLQISSGGDGVCLCQT